jgi:glucose dehydrogenase
MRTVRWILVGVAIVLGTAFAAAQQGARGGEWTRYGGDAGSTRYAPVDQINKDNVSHLRVAWQRQAVDPSVSSRSPISPLRTTSARHR